MKQMLKDFSNLLLVVLWDCVLGEADYLLLVKPDHVALSNSSVSVEFQALDGANGTLRNVSVLLLEANSNQTVTTKYLETNDSQGRLEFECFFFREAGDYWFVMAPDGADNSSAEPWWESGAALRVEWPVFHVDLNRTSQAAEGTFQVGLATSQPLCAFPSGQPEILVDVVFTNSLPQARADRGPPVEIRSGKRAELSQAQWLEFGCAPVGPEAYVTVVLKLLGQDAAITSVGPIDLARKFGYKLVLVPELTCESQVEVTVLPPPCTFVQGVVTVSLEAPGRPGERTPRLATNSLALGQRRTAFNCSLFDMGRNKYCFDFGVSGRSFPAQEKACVLIQRNIETWGLWQPWSPCSATCGDGMRERHRLCLTASPSKARCPGAASETSPCSLEDCAAFRPSSPPPPPPEGQSNNVVTVTGISLCLVIIAATVLVTLWRRFGRGPECGPARAPSLPLRAPGPRHSDEEDMCARSEPRGSLSDGGDARADEDAAIPLTSRRAAADDAASGRESLGRSAQRILPPLFSYRLAQQQLKEMKQQGLTETTKVYHVSQSPLTDTAIDAPSAPTTTTATTPTPLEPDGAADAAAHKFRLKSPFLEAPGAAVPRLLLLDAAAPAGCAVSPSQTLIRKAQLRQLGSGRGGHPRGAHFRRTASFHEGKQARPFRERSLSTLSPRQAPAASSARSWTWDQAEERGARPQSRGAGPWLDTGGLLSPLPKSYSSLGQPGKKQDLGEHQGGLVAGERTETHRPRRGPSLGHRSASRKQPSPSTLKESCYPGVAPLSPARCQGFPAHPEFAFYDNTSFGLTESEQRMLDLPGYFGSNEEDETTSTLSMEKLVI